jgi:predicted S18 family serine protease
MLLALAACEYFGSSSEAYRNLSTTRYSELKPEMLSLADTIEQSYMEKKERLAGITDELSDLLLGMEKSLDMMELAHNKLVEYENSLYNQ